MTTAAFVMLYMNSLMVYWVLFLMLKTLVLNVTVQKY